MTPYYKRGNVRLYLGDVFDVLRSLPDASVDAVVTDPPYSSGGQFRSETARPTSEKYGGWSHDATGTRKPSAVYSAFGGDNKDGRVFLAWSIEWMREAFRVSKDGGFFAMTTDWRQLPAVTDAMQFAGWTWRGMLVWNKQVGRPVAGRFRNHVEYVVWGSRGGFVGDDDIYASSIHTETPPTSATRHHITEKPVALMAFIMSVMQAGGVVLDPFMGSGSTGLAAVGAGRGFIGGEVDRHWLDSAAKRLDAALSQGQLFEVAA